MNGYELDHYQYEAARTMGTRDLTMLGLGIAGEAGEVADMIKKHVYHGHPLDSEKLVKEIGDVLWYVSGIAESLGVALSVVAQKNVDKLKKRYPDGFSIQASIGRGDL